MTRAYCYAPLRGRCNERSLISVDAGPSDCRDAPAPPRGGCFSRELVIKRVLTRTENIKTKRLEPRMSKKRPRVAVF